MSIKRGSISTPTPAHFEPSSAMLTAMLDRACARFDHSREDALAKKDWAENAREVRAQAMAAKARYYFDLQHGRAR